VNIYRPSAVKDYHRCPVLWHLKHVKGWRAKTYGYPDIAAAIGWGMAAAAAYEYGPRVGPYAVKTAQGIATARYEAEIAKLEEAGIEYRQKPRDYITKEGAPRVLQKGVERFIQWNPIPDDWTIMAVETTLTDYGNCTPDLVCHDPTNLAVVDWKCEMRAADKEYWKQQKVEEYDQDWSMKHYCWALSEKYKEPCMRYYIGLITLTPKFNIELLPYELAEEDMAAWYASAQTTWVEMEDNRMLQVANHWGKWGKCEMYDACFKHRYKEHLMLRDYVQLQQGT